MDIFFTEWYQSYQKFIKNLMENQNKYTKTQLQNMLCDQNFHLCRLENAFKALQKHIEEKPLKFPAEIRVLDESQNCTDSAKYMTILRTNEKSVHGDDGNFKYSPISTLDGYERMIINLLRLDHVKEFTLEIQKTATDIPNMEYELKSYFFNPEYSSKNKPKKKPKLELVKPSK